MPRPIPRDPPSVRDLEMVPFRRFRESENRESVQEILRQSADLGEINEAVRASFMSFSQTSLPPPTSSTSVPKNFVKNYSKSHDSDDEYYEIYNPTVASCSSTL